jgi:D-tyrosyl-tRNA(Tyr) deacylase
MRALLQRVSRAEVRVGPDAVGRIGHGLLIFLGVAPTDEVATAVSLARKVVELRIFPDEAGRTNRSLIEAGGEALVVSQFTLFADARRGRRPGFSGAAEPSLAEALYERFAGELGALGPRVERGRFGAEMAVELVNDGPFTLWLDTDVRSAGPDAIDPRASVDVGGPGSGEANRSAGPPKG